MENCKQLLTQPIAESNNIEDDLVDFNLQVSILNNNQRVLNVPDTPPRNRNHQLEGFYEDGNPNIEEFRTVTSQNLAKLITASKNELTENIVELDKNIANILKRYELEYAQAYNIFVSHKEREIKQLIDQITERTGNQQVKDKKLQAALDAERRLREQVNKLEVETKQFRDEIVDLTRQVQNQREQKEFYHTQSLDQTRQKKLLKIALNRVEDELQAQTVKMQILESEHKFEDQLQKQVNIARQQNTGAASTKYEIMKNPSLQSIFSRNSNNFVSLGQITRRHHSVHHGQGMIPTENLKFEQFVQVALNSQLPTEEIQREICDYFRVLETSYTEKITNQQIIIDRHKKATQLERIKNQGQLQEVSDLCQIFVECVDDVRKLVAKRRIKNQIANNISRPVNPFNTYNSKSDFEETLINLTDLTQGRFRQEQFTSVDRHNILDLFVNNEKVLITIHEALFPKSTINLKQMQQLKNPSDKIILNSSNTITNDTQMQISKPELTLTQKKAAFVQQEIEFASVADFSKRQKSDVKQRLPSIHSPKTRSDQQLGQRGYFEMQPYLM